MSLGDRCQNSAECKLVENGVCNGGVCKCVGGYSRVRANLCVPNSEGTLFFGCTTNNLNKNSLINFAVSTYNAKVSQCNKQSAPQNTPAPASISDGAEKISGVAFAFVIVSLCFMSF